MLKNASKLPKGYAVFAENNPFTPSFGRMPPYMAGRKPLVNDLSRAFSGNGNDPYLQTILVGARGTGKTALLTRAGEIASAHGWVCANARCADGMLDDLLQRALDASAELVATHGGPKLKGVSIAQIVGVEWDPAREPPENWRTQMTRLLDGLSETKTGLVFTVDEVRPNVAEMEQLASTFQHFVREGRRVALLMAGLPHQASQLVNSDAVSFLRRATHVSLNGIEDEDIEDALLKTVKDGGKSIEGAALDACVAAIGGFAYMMQLVGFRVWDASDEAPTITLADAERGIANAHADLERQIIIPTWASLSNGDKSFCHSLARGNDNAREIAGDLGKKPNYVSKYKQRLLEQGVIEQDPYARLHFALPGFGDFVRQAE